MQLLNESDGIHHVKKSTARIFMYYCLTKAVLPLSIMLLNPEFSDGLVL